MVVGGACLVAWAEIEDPSGPASERATRAEHLASGEPTDQDQFVRRRDVEVLAVHLLMRQLEVLADAGGDGVSGRDHPEAFFVAALTPLQITTCSHQALEHPRKVSGVQHDQAHAGIDPLHDTIDHLIADFAVGEMPPPDEHVRLVKPLLGQPVLWLIQRRGADHEVSIRGQCRRDRAMNAIRIDLPDDLALALMAKFIPHHHANRGHPALLRLVRHVLRRWRSLGRVRPRRRLPRSVGPVAGLPRHWGRTARQREWRRRTCGRFHRGHGER